MRHFRKDWFKYIAVFAACLLFRLVPLRAPNVEPILAAQMPFAKAYGAAAGFIFAFLSIVVYDILTGFVGIWTIITATAYGLLGIWAFAYFKNKKSSRWNYVKFAVMATLAYDALTGLSIGPMLFDQPFLAALVGQAPFTALHLAGNVGFAATLSPLIQRFITENKKFETKSAISVFHTKTI